MGWAEFYICIAFINGILAFVHALDSDVAMTIFQGVTTLGWLIVGLYMHSRNDHKRG